METWEWIGLVIVSIIALRCAGQLIVWVIDQTFEIVMFATKVAFVMVMFGCEIISELVGYLRRKDKVDPATFE